MVGETGTPAGVRETAKEGMVGGGRGVIVYNRVDREIFITPFLSYAYK